MAQVRPRNPPPLEESREALTATNSCRVHLGCVGAQRDDRGQHYDQKIFQSGLTNAKIGIPQAPGDIGTLDCRFHFSGRTRAQCKFNLRKFHKIS
jgi:hypothetical protein